MEMVMKKTIIALTVATFAMGSAGVALAGSHAKMKPCDPPKAGHALNDKGECVKAEDAMKKDAMKKDGMKKDAMKKEKK